MRIAQVGLQCERSAISNERIVEAIEVEQHVTAVIPGGRVIRSKFQGRIAMRESLLAVFLAAQHDAQMTVCKHGLRIKHQGLFERSDGVRVVAELALHPSAIDQRIRRLWPDAQRFIDPVESGRIITALAFDDAEHMQGIELLLIGLQDELVEKLRLRDVAGLMSRECAGKYLLRL